MRNDWITIGLAKSCRTKKILYLKWRENRTTKNWNAYLSYKRTLDKLLHKAKYDYYNKKFQDNQSDTKKTWQLINNILGRKRSNKLLTFPNHDAAHNFNKYFTSIATDLISRNYSNINHEDNFEKYMVVDPISLLEESVFDSVDVKYFISQLNDNKGTYFSPKILKLVSDILSPVLTK